MTDFEPRLNQIFVPLLSLAGDSQVRAELRELAQRYNRELVVERGMDAETGKAERCLQRNLAVLRAKVEQRAVSVEQPD